MVFLQASRKPMPVLQESCETMQILQDKLEYHWQLSQAAACDGMLYQVGSEDGRSNPGPGIQPI